MKVRDSAGDTTEENSNIFSVIPNVLVAISKVMHAVKLCSNKVLHFLNGVAGCQKLGKQLKTDLSDGC